MIYRQLQCKKVSQLLRLRSRIDPKLGLGSNLSLDSFGNSRIKEDCQECIVGLGLL